ncbi:methionine synthase II (cobalamin-independent) [Halanaerobium saccharolyticum]|uniref:Methionine synthase II (Cobalamin-independent) n=1 Tax=Halanaerobium saccharolyticum TaxID=43595 RepID=A0A4R7Z6X7_9FIRM|nr:5-methyltetrahydropteroyltriglutamate--homocysteine S-methyltransferase [Halanaerobium saccharolyticum]RAK12470.1 methionine synthase II (cobalamin-independent) [Halanaerobium saccharolyticum]TDW06396.1 methionine synthase II (cobalamin-independent) [Halanaerobium saccharolyticum]TDX61644.1 methionine synthase II (cobalamin-independent) [Halanaerobium saccharolyticum]
MGADQIQAPFRADHVGSLLRPKRLLKAKSNFKQGKIGAAELHQIEREEVEKAVNKQLEAGLKLVTDGEFRRDWWHLDFLEELNGFEGYVPEKGYQFADLETEAYDVRNTGKISFNSDHSFLKYFKEFNKIVDGRAAAKQTIPSPNQLFHFGIRNSEIYPDIKDYAQDIIETYQDALKAFYEAGVRYLQFDDVYIASLSSPDISYQDAPFSREYLIELALEVVNGVLEVKPPDLSLTTHLCRGNYKSSWAFSGSYDLIAPTLFAREKVDGFFLEYDDQRSGGFEPLKYIPEGKTKVVLGLITSKDGQLEDKEKVKARIRQAAEYIPLSQLCLSPQCGFASTHHGNQLSQEDQWQKLKLIVEIAEEIWG